MTALDEIRSLVSSYGDAAKAVGAANALGSVEAHHYQTEIDTETDLLLAILSLAEDASKYRASSPRKAEVPVANNHAPATKETVKFTTGHCNHHKVPGGCPVPNVHCGWPECDRRPL